jgi:DNA-binding response OmpR family regulator
MLQLVRNTPALRRQQMPITPQARVLSVDDDIDAGKMLELILKSDGISVTCAHSADEAWLMIQAQDFDLFLLDSWLPRTDGFELCRQIRATDAKTPILFYSGAAYDTDKEKGMAAGANAYVVKPELGTLSQTITDLIVQAEGRKSTRPLGSYATFTTLLTDRLEAQRSSLAASQLVASFG